MKNFLRRRRAEFVAGVLALFVALCFTPQVLHFSHRNDAERVVWTNLPLWQTLESFEYRLYDARFVARGIRKPESLDKIAIVGVDENTLRVGDWPMPRRNYAPLIRALKAAGARVIALDFDFSQPQTPLDDAALERAVHSAGNVLLISYLTPELDQSKKTATFTLRTTTPLDRFDQWTPDLSLVYIPLDSDERARRYPLYAVINGTPVGSLAALAAASYQKILDGNENKKYEQLLENRQWPSLQNGLCQVPVFASRDPQTRSDVPIVFSTPLCFWGPRKTFPTYSFVDVQQGKYSAAEMRQLFGGKIVFVGPTAHILKDEFAAPSFVNSGESENSLRNRDSNLAELPGVELHAAATAMLLDGTYIRTQSTRSALWTLLGLTLFSSLWAASLRGLVSQAARGAQVLWTRRRLPGQIHTTLWFALYLVLGALPIVSFWLAAQWLFTNHNFWLIAAYPLLSAGMATGLVLLLLFGVESGERRKTEMLFSRAASPQLTAKMLASGEDYLQPEVICLTVLFTDLEGFTTYSESHAPREVIEVTNDFLSSVVPIIHQYDGWVDKYIGDAIMAVFGAPVEREDHAEVALRCAVEMQDAAAKWRKKTGIGFYMRAGIHTGEVIAGYMGSRESKNSRERMDYTVIGDTVNLASRLEGKNKEFGSWIMCSAQTFEAAPDIVAAQNVSASIKGKSKEVEVYIVRGLKDEPERDKNWAKDVS
jgi:adenylate cyclase